MFYPPHPYAAMFPPMDDETFRLFKEDIRVNGQREPIILTPNGKILDGLNRLAACADLHIDAIYTQYEGPDDDRSLLAFVIRKNLHRRHMTESQRAAVAAKIANLGHGGDRKQDQGANLRLDPVVQQTEAAALLNVSRRSVQAAKKVEKADPALFEKVRTGEVSVSKAERIVREKAAKPAPVEDVAAGVADMGEILKGTADPSTYRVHVPEDAARDDEGEQEFKALVELWRASSRSTKARFRAFVAEEAQ